MAELLEQNIAAVIAALISFTAAWAIMRQRVGALEKTVENGAKLLDEYRIKIERRDEEIKQVQEHLARIDELKLEAQLAEIKTELRYIRTMLEKVSGMKYDG